MPGYSSGTPAVMALAGASTAYSQVSAALKFSFVKEMVGLSAGPFIPLRPPAKAASQEQCCEKYLFSQLVREGALGLPK